MSVRTVHRLEQTLGFFYYLNRNPALIQRGHNIHISLKKHWWCVLCCLFQLPLSKEDDNSSCWMSPRWAICGFDSWWRPISLPSLRANASSVHDIYQLESFLAGFSLPCLVYIACEQVLLFGRTKRAAREHASELRRPPASRASTFFYIPQMESFLAGYCLYRYSLAISLSWVMFSDTVILQGPHVRVSGSFYSLKHSTVSISC